MRLSAYLRGTNYLISQFILVLCLGLIIIAFTTKLYILLILPVLVGFFLIILFFPEITPYIFIATNFYGGFLFEKSRIGVTITDLFSFIVVIAYFGSFTTRRNSDKEYNINIYNRKILYILLLFLISSLLSFFINISNISTNYIYISIWYLIKLIQLPLIFLVFSKLPIKREQLEKFINICLILSLLQLPVALYQYYSFRSYGLIQLRSLVHGTLTYHHTLLGTFMLIPLSFTLYRFLNTEVKKEKLWYSIIMILSTIIIIFSGSRSAFFGIFLSLIIFFFFHFRLKINHFVYLFIIIAGLIALYFFTPLGANVALTFQSNQTKYFDLSSASRFFIWLGAIKHFISADFLKKLFGVGIGCYPTIQYDFVIWGSSKIASGAHNNLLHVLCEIGVFGLIIFIMLFYYILKALYKNRTNLLSKSYFFLTIALLSSSLTQETFWFQKSFGSFWLFYIFFLAIVLQTKQKDVI